MGAGCWEGDADGNEAFGCGGDIFEAELWRFIDSFMVGSGKLLFGGLAAGPLLLAYDWEEGFDSVPVDEGIGGSCFPTPLPLPLPLPALWLAEMGALEPILWALLTALMLASESALLL